MQSGLPKSVIENFIIVNKSHQKDHILFLYTPQVDRMDIFNSFMRERSYSESPAYISTGFTEKKEIQEKFRNTHTGREFDVFFGCSNIGNITGKLEELYRMAERGNPVRIILDYSDISQLTNEDIIGIERSIYEKKGPPISIMSVFDTSKINYKTLASIQKFHDKVLVITEDKSTALICDKKHAGNKEEGIETIIEPQLKKMVKDNLRLIVLSILSNDGVSGYDIIKSIDKKFHIRLSPGTIYPLLYSLKKEGLIGMKDIEDDSRRKIYVPAKDGKKIIENELSNFIVAQRHLSDFLCSGDL